VSTEGTTAERPTLPVAAVAIVGALAALALAAAPPAGSGARSALSPPALLAVFDAAWVLLLARPGPRGVAETCALLAVGVPFHAVLGAEAGAGPGHLAAFAIAALSWAGAGLAAASGGRVAAAAVAFAAFGLPLASYAVAEFLLRGPTSAACSLASPLMGSVLLARTAPAVAVGDAVPAVVGAALVAAVSLVGRARRMP